MKKFLGLLTAFALMANFAMAQASFDIPVTITVGATTSILHLGVNPGNTIGYDGSGMVPSTFNEQLAPPAPPAPYDLDARFLTPAGYTTTLPIGLGAGVSKDFRNYVSAVQVDTFRIKLASDDGNGAAVSPWTISWPAGLNLYGSSWIIKPATGADFASTNMTSTTSVTFAPSATSLFVLVIKTGATQPSPGPNFVLNNASLSFGTVNVGNSATQQVTVTNTGTTNALSITGVTPIAGYSVVANPAGAFPIAVAPGASRNFDVTFTPTVGGAANGNIVFASNAGSNNLAVTGNGLSQGGSLAFATANPVRFDNTTGYKDSLTLTYGGGALKAIQFRIITNGLVIVRSVSRGSAIPNPQFNFSSVITRGVIGVDGSSPDTIKVVILGNGTNALPAGSYSNFVNFEYDAVNISEPDSQTAPLSIQNVFSSLFDGSPAGVTAGANKTITLANRTMVGDINNDDHLDVLDLLMIIDHILNRTTLTGQAFVRADVAPWGARDGVVDVQDLALLQNIILTGQYPNGVKIEVTAPSVPSTKNVFAKSELSSDAKVTYFVTEKGIVVKLENRVTVKGLQLDFSNIGENVVVKNASSIFGGASINVDKSSLRLIVVSESGASIEPGTHIVAQIPFSIKDPSSIAASNLTLGGSNNARIKDVESNISLNEAPELPTSFNLQQNYPNPFNPATMIQFAVPQDAFVRISIYNVLGQEVRSLFNGDVRQGTYAARWDGRDNSGIAVSSGTYIYRMSSGSFVETRKMMLMK
jgi:hypothetical protein